MPFWELFTTGEVLGDSTGLVPPRLWHWWHREPRLDILQLLLRHVHMAQSSPTWCPRHEHRALGCKATPSPGKHGLVELPAPPEPHSQRGAVHPNLEHSRASDHPAIHLWGGQSSTATTLVALSETGDVPHPCSADPQLWKKKLPSISFCQQ